MKKLPTITVASCAFNEASNIESFLHSVLLQKEVGFKIKKILIISDGSTDKTVEIIKKVNSPLIQVVEHKKRLGKSFHLNTIYQDLETDILVQTDCDVIFSNPLVISNITRPLIAKKDKIEMTGGNPQPVQAKTFIEKAINTSVLPYLSFRKKIRNGNNVFSADGRLLAYNKKLIKQIHIPTSMIANDMFTYFCCLSLGYQYKFVHNAVVLFRSPQNLKDHILQNTRFRAAPIRMEKYFGKVLVQNEITIPKKLFISELVKVGIKFPVLSMTIYSINLYCKIKAKLIEYRLHAKWDMALTTKKI